MRFKELFEYNTLAKDKNPRKKDDADLSDKEVNDDSVDDVANVEDNDVTDDEEDNSDLAPSAKKPVKTTKIQQPIEKPEHVQGTSAAGQPSPTRKQIMDRAKEMGFDSVLYHASTHDIEEFDANKSHVYNDWGRGIYATNSTEDAIANYAGIGPDLTTRIELEADNILSSLSNMVDYEVEEYLEEHGYDLEDYDNNGDEVAKNIAKKRLMGTAEQGVVYPIMVNRKKMVIIDGNNSTKIPGKHRDDFYQIAKEEIDAADYDDEDAYEEAVTERTDELYCDDPSTYVGIIRNALEVIGVDDNDKDGIMSYMLDYDVTNLGDIDRYIRRNNVSLYDFDVDSEYIGGAISALLFAELGFTGVIDKTVNEKFGSRSNLRTPMAGVTKGVEHTIVFPGHENLVRSVFAAFDPNAMHSRKLLASDDPDKEVDQDPEVQRICELSGIGRE